MKHKFLFLINPISGTRSKARLTDTIKRTCEAEGFSFSIAETDIAGTYHAIKNRIEQEQFTRVVICGGDGSVNQVVGALRNTDVEFAILPMGSGNGMAFAAGIPRNLQRALAIALTEPAVETDAFLLNDQFGCMLCGTGFDATIAHDFAQQKKRGLFTYIKRSFLHFFSSKVYPYTIETHDNHIDVECYFISVANSNQFGNHVTIAPRASLNDGLLDIVVVKKMNRFRLLHEIAWQIRMGKVDASGDLSQNKQILYFQSPFIRIHNKSKARVHIDGEPVASSEWINVQIIPKAFKLVQPNG